jgi:hypothetical protein
MTADVPNAFVQTQCLQPRMESQWLWKSQECWVDLLVEMAPDFYGPYVVYERKEKFYVGVESALRNVDCIRLH